MSTILVAYGSRYGSTRGVAEAIAETLRSHGVEADVRPAAHVADPARYVAAIVGGGVYASKWHPEALAFIQPHRQALAALPTACFALGTAFVNGGEEADRQRSALADQIREHVGPVDIAFFAGSTAGLPFLMRLLSRLMRSPPGDHRDWAAIRGWADALVPKLHPEP